jgi:hypothetical protein
LNIYSGLGGLLGGGVANLTGSGWGGTAIGGVAGAGLQKLLTSPRVATETLSLLGNIGERGKRSAIPYLTGGTLSLYDALRNKGEPE